MIKDIVVLGHPALRNYSATVHAGSQTVALIKDLRDTMRAAGGIGLAAPQIGINQRVAVIELDQFKLDLVNPVVQLDGQRTLGEEGCLSLPDMFAQVLRYNEVLLYTLDPFTGEQKVFNAAGLLARAIQHECDHLDGCLFFDNLGTFKRQ